MERAGEGRDAWQFGCVLLCERVEGAGGAGEPNPPVDPDRPWDASEVLPRSAPASASASDASDASGPGSGAASGTVASAEAALTHASLPPLRVKDAVPLAPRIVSCELGGGPVAEAVWREARGRALRAGWADTGDCFGWAAAVEPEGGAGARVGAGHGPDGASGALHGGAGGWVEPAWSIEWAGGGGCRAGTVAGPRLGRLQAKVLGVHGVGRTGGSGAVRAVPGRQVESVRLLVPLPRLTALDGAGGSPGEQMLREARAWARAGEAASPGARDSPGAGPLSPVLPAAGTVAAPLLSAQSAAPPPSGATADSVRAAARALLALPLSAPAAGPLGSALAQATGAPGEAAAQLARAVSRSIAPAQPSASSSSSLSPSGSSGSEGHAAGAAALVQSLAGGSSGSSEAENVRDSLPEPESKTVHLFCDSESHSVYPLELPTADGAEALLRSIRAATAAAFEAWDGACEAGQLMRGAPAEHEPTSPWDGETGSTTRARRPQEPANDARGFVRVRRRVLLRERAQLWAAVATAPGSPVGLAARGAAALLALQCDTDSGAATPRHVRVLAGAQPHPVAPGSCPLPPLLVAAGCAQREALLALRPIGAQPIEEARSEALGAGAARPPAEGASHGGAGATDESFRALVRTMGLPGDSRPSDGRNAVHLAAAREDAHEALWALAGHEPDMFGGGSGGDSSVPP